MKATLKRAFVGAGLVMLAAPGAAAEHLNTWGFVGLGVLAGLIASVVTWEWK